MNAAKTVPAGNALSRRSLLGALAALPAAALPAKAAPVAPPTSSLCDLIAEYRWRRFEADAADLFEGKAYAEFIRLHPLPVVHVGRKIVKDPKTGFNMQDPDSDDWLYTTWQFSHAEEIQQYFRFADHPWPSTQSEKQKAVARVRRDAHLAELESLWEAWRDAKAAHGVTDLEVAATTTYNAMCDVREAIFAYRPATLAELDVKNRFVVDHFSQRGEIEWHEIASIFGADPGSVTRETDAVMA
jgi:hypothetical protein